MSEVENQSEPSVRARISNRIDQLEAARGVTVLYTCESGSRAWGFPSIDSDYDVRLIYAHPRDWYLSIDVEQRDDTVDPPIDGEIDLHGWDLRKALRLFRAANPTLLEWLRSPIVYRANEVVMARWRSLLSDYHTPAAVGPAYRGMAQSVAEQNRTDDTMSHKASLYVLRALLAVRWIERGEDGPPPVRFERLVDATVDRTDLREAVEALLAHKRAGREQDEGPCLPALHNFIEAELDRQAGLSFADSPARPGIAPLNSFFRWVLTHHVPEEEGE
ncbi:MAG: nucleotidyltransferase [Bacteroidetes bacterium SW_9_63_38]|nr:MAG: nucleotidyltransferase [Bacteroidetes bacterium SW_9_63_38]